MALATYNVSSEGIGNNAQLAFPFTFKITELSHLLVVITSAAGVEVSRVRGTDVVVLSSVVFDASVGGGTVNLLIAPAGGARVLMLLANDAPKQPSEFKNKFDLALKRIEDAYDYIASALQRVSYLAQRSVKLHDLDNAVTFNPTLPKGVSAIVTDRVPYITTNGWAPVALWPLLTDLAAAVSAAAAAAAAQASAAASAVSAAVSVAAAAASSASAAASAASAAASASAADATPGLSGTYAAPTGVTTQIAFTGTRWNNTYCVQGNAADQILSSNPRIAAATAIGQRLRVIVPHTATFKVTINDGNGMQQNGPAVLSPGASIDYEWVTGNLWFETGRNS